MDNVEMKPPEDVEPVKPVESDTPEQVLELNFVPTWARRPPRSYEADRRGGSDSESRGGREHRPGRRERRDEPDRRERRGGRDDRRRTQTERDGQRGPRDDRLRERRPLPPPAPEPARIHLRFLPEPRHLAAVVRQVHSEMKSFPLHDMAMLFLNNPAYCQVTIEPRAADIRIFQCSKCRLAGLEREALVSHVVQSHLADYYDREEKVGDPPSGQFVFMGVCGLSGALLGPPNHHSFSERVAEMHRTRYADMPLEAYKRRIRTVQDPALVEKWKEESRKQVVYKLKGADGASAEAVKIAAAEAHMSRDVAPKLIQEMKKAVVPLDIALKGMGASADRSLQGALRRESRVPLNLMLALRGAFKARHLHLFKVGREHVFVTPVKPAPLDPAHVVESIREVLNHLHANPGCTRAKMIESLRPGVAPDSPEAAKVLAPLSWLIERGHIIEFFNGALAVPLASGTGANAPRREARPETGPETPEQGAPPVEAK